MPIRVSSPSDHVRLLTLDRPEVLNAMTVEDIEELDGLVCGFDADPEVHCLVITGAGRSFCSGNDIHEMAGADDDQMALLELRRRDPTLRWASTTVPKIAAVNGNAYGYGAILAVGASLRVGSPSTAFRVTAARYGGANLTWNLPLLIGTARARDLLLTSRTVRGEEAYRLGLLDRLVGDHEIVDAAIALASEIAANDPAGTRRINQLVDQAHGTSLQARFDAEHALQMSNMRGKSGASIFSGFLEGSGRNHQGG